MLHVSYEYVRYGSRGAHRRQLTYYYTPFKWITSFCRLLRSGERATRKKVSRTNRRNEKFSASISTVPASKVFDFILFLRKVRASRVKMSACYSRRLYGFRGCVGSEKFVVSLSKETYPVINVEHEADEDECKDGDEEGK